VLWLVPGLALTKYRCEFVNLNCMFTLTVTLTLTLTLSNPNPNSKAALTCEIKLK